MAAGSTWRTNLIRKCKTLQKRVLCISDEEYRALLEEQYGKSSTADLTLDQLQDLAAHLDGKAGKTDKPMATLAEPMAQKIWMLWQGLHKAGVVRDPSEAALNAYTARMTRRGNKPGVASYRWLNRYQARDVIEALKKWSQRVGVGNG